MSGTRALVGRRVCCAILICVLSTGAGGVKKGRGAAVPTEYGWTQLPSFAELIDAGRSVTRPMEYKLPSLIVDALRITDEAAVAAKKAAEAGKEMAGSVGWRHTAAKALGRLAGGLEALNAGLKTYDQSVKERAWNTAVVGTGVVEFAKWLLGNAAGGWAAGQVVAAGSGLGWGLVAGWVAVSLAEAGIDGTARLLGREGLAKLPDTHFGPTAAIAAANRNLSADARMRADLARLRATLRVPDDAVVTWKVDREGRRVRETVWSTSTWVDGREEQRTIAHLACYDKLGNIQWHGIDRLEGIAELHRRLQLAIGSAEFWPASKQSLASELAEGAAQAPRRVEPTAPSGDYSGPGPMQVPTAPDVDLIPMPIPEEPRK
jgi:hypothetical protein